MVKNDQNFDKNSDIYPDFLDFNTSRKRDFVHFLY